MKNYYFIFEFLNFDFFYYFNLYNYFKLRACLPNYHHLSFSKISAHISMQRWCTMWLYWGSPKLNLQRKEYSLWTWMDSIWKGRQKDKKYQLGPISEEMKALHTHCFLQSVSDGYGIFRKMHWCKLWGRKIWLQLRYLV